MTGFISTEIENCVGNLRWFDKICDLSNIPFISLRHILEASLTLFRHPLNTRLDEVAEDRARRKFYFERKILRKKDEYFQTLSPLFRPNRPIGTNNVKFPQAKKKAGNSNIARFETLTLPYLTYSTRPHAVTMMVISSNATSKASSSQVKLPKQSESRSQA